MSVVIIGDAERAQIKAAIERASANPVLWETMRDHVIMDDRPTLPLADRKPGLERPASEHLMLGNVRVAYSHEQQPAGMLRHLSASVHKKGKLPHPVAIEEICAAFGFRHFPPIEGRIWIEEYEPGYEAVNVVEIITPATAGHA